LRKENEILREANQGQDAERIGVMNQRNQAWAEVERLRNRVTRLRKALNWMRGCFDPESWEYKRATVVLDEEAE
jgi:transposase